MYIPKWGSNFCFTFPTSEGSDLLSSHVMQTPTFISKLSDGNVIFRLDVGKSKFRLYYLQFVILQLSEVLILLYGASFFFNFFGNIRNDWHYLCL
jgi:hypothetical protein